MPEYTFEILRTRTVVIDERIERTINVPKSVPEDERGDWVMGQIESEKLEFPDSDWEVADETESSDLQEATQLD